MKYKINEEVEFKANSVDKGKVVSFEEETSMYSVEIPGGKVIALYMGNLQIAAIALGFGATLGFVRRIARIWE